MNARRIVCATALLVGAAASAHADSSWLGITALGWEQAPGRLFVSPGVEGGNWRLGHWNSGVTEHAGATGVTAGPLTTTPDLSGVSPGFTVGYVFRDGDVPAWLGSRVRIGFTGTSLHYRDTGSTSSVLTGSGCVNHVHVNGTLGNFYCLTGAGTTESLRVLREGFDLSLRAASDFPLRPGLTFTPSIAVFGGRTVDTYNYQHFGILAPTFVSFGMNEEVRTRSFGGDFAAGLTWQALPYLALNATGRVGVAWMRTSLDAQSSCNAGGGFGCLGTSVNASASDSRSTVGIRTGASLGASLDMRFGILTIGGFFSYDSRIPGVAHSTVPAFTLVNPNLASARIRFDDGFRYGGMLNLRIPLL